jgi:hypothetical protein
MMKSLGESIDRVWERPIFSHRARRS